MKPFEFDRSWEFELPPSRLWAVLSQTDAYSRWWPWLRSFDPVPLEPGARTRCAIGPPLPYLLHLVLDVAEVVPEKLLAADVTGDVAGPARLEIKATSTGSEARLVWELQVRRSMLRAAARTARPLLQWGHDWVVTQGVEQFRRAAIPPGP